jgi:hypothetical protein
MSLSLSPAEKRALAKAEAVIETNVRAFVEVGSALARIRDDRLYRETSQSFESYVAVRWSWPVSRAYQQIWAAETMQALQATEGVDELPRNELVARELSTLLRTDQGHLLTEAWQRAVKEADGSPPTHMHARTAVRALRFLHSDYRERVGDPAPGEPLVLPDVLLRDMQRVVRLARRNLTNTPVPTRRQLRHLDASWRWDLSVEVTETLALLEGWLDALRQAE